MEEEAPGGIPVAVGKRMQPREGSVASGAGDGTGGARAERIALVLLALLVFATRVPFLDLGYGWDYDGWGNVDAARRIATGECVFASRPPGYPVVITVFSHLWNLGPLAINGLTAVFSALSAAIMASIFLRLGSRLHVALLAGLALAFTPIVFANSSNAMDYVWALAFDLAAFRLALDRKATLAGMCLGVATGCRITSLALALPLSMLLGMDGGRRFAGWRKTIPFLGASFLAACICYLPVLQEYGIGHLTFSHQSFSGFIPYLPSMVFSGLLGPLATLALVPAVACAIGRGRAPGAVPATGRSASLLMAACGLTLVLYGAAFVRLPAEAAYLIPIVPFLLLLLGLRLGSKALCSFCLVLGLSPFLLSLVKDPRDVYAVEGPAWRRYVNRVEWKGAVLNGKALRERQRSGIESVFAAAGRMGNGRVTIVASSYVEYLRVLAPLRQGPQRFRIVEAMDEASVRRALGQGEGVLFVRGYDNVLALGWSEHLDDLGRLTPVVEFQLRSNAAGRLVADPPTDLDRTLVASALDPNAYAGFLNLWVATPMVVPVRSDGTPWLLQHGGRPTLPVFDRPDRLEQLRQLGQGGLSRTESVQSLLRSLPEGVGIALNFGGPTERIFPEDELLMIRTALAQPAPAH